jgi:hypothetical protein
MYNSFRAFARHVGTFVARRHVLAVALVAFSALLIQPALKADVIYTFYDSGGQVILEFSTPYIVTPSTAPVNVTNFIVAPNGFLPCTLQIYNKTTTANTLGCVGAHGTELWAITNGAFPTIPGPFTTTFMDVLYAFAGDIPDGSGNISPEPASLLLFGTGMGMIGLWKKSRRKRTQDQQVT